MEPKERGRALAGHGASQVELPCLASGCPSVWGDLGEISEVLETCLIPGPLMSAPCWGGGGFWCCGSGLLGMALKEGGRMEENNAQGRVACLGLPEDAPGMARTQLSFLFLEHFLKHHLQRAPDPSETLDKPQGSCFAVAA